MQITLAGYSAIMFCFNTLDELVPLFASAPVAAVRLPLVLFVLTGPCRAWWFLISGPLSMVPTHRIPHLHAPLHVDRQQYHWSPWQDVPVPAKSQNTASLLQGGLGLTIAQLTWPLSISGATLVLFALFV